jgi:RNA polymerase sigma-70 factor (ECF subfamily)
VTGHRSSGATDGRKRDAALVRRALAGSQEAFADIVERYRRPLFSLIVRMVKDPALAEDLAQESFVKAFHALQSFDPDRKLSSWLFTIAHNATIDHLRRKRPDTVPLATSEEGPNLVDRLAAPDGESPEEHALRRDLARAFEEELRRLRPEYAEVLVLRFQEGLSYEEIAEVAGVPIGTVKTHIFRARRALAERLAARGWEPSS